MNQAEKVKEYAKRHASYDARRISKNMGIPAAIVRQVLSGRAVAVKGKQKLGRPLTEFRATFDKDFIVPKRIREGLKELGNGWEYEAEFIRHIGVRAIDLAAYRDQFADHIVTIRVESKRAWAGTVAAAKQMREMV